MDIPGNAIITPELIDVKRTGTGIPPGDFDRVIGMIARQRIPGDTVLTSGKYEMKRKIVYISGTRADYGLMRSVLFKIQSSPEFDLVVVVTGMHSYGGVREFR